MPLPPWQQTYLGATRVVGGLLAEESLMKRLTPNRAGLDLGPCLENRTDFRSAFEARTKVRPYRSLHRFG